MEPQSPTIVARAKRLEESEETDCTDEGSCRTEADYLARFRSVMSRSPPRQSIEHHKEPTKIFDFLYLGNMDNAQNKRVVEELGITHIINCVGGVYENYKTGGRYYGDGVKRYVEFEAEDLPNYDMTQHIDTAYDVIEDARQTGGRAFIHCEVGVNRSGMLTVAYVMLHNVCDPITAAMFVKDKRKWLLSNVAFQRQLVQFALKRKLLAFPENETAAGTTDHNL